MKSMIFAAALLCGSAALAQDAGTATQPDPVEPTTTVSESLATPAPAAGSQISAPGNTTLEVDGNGVPVVSDPATVPAGFNQAPGMNGVGGPLVDASQPPAPQPATESYPPCSRTITDNCIQHERRARRPR